MKEPSGPGIRNDCGVYAGFQVPVEYDPILSKLIAHAENRDAAIQRMIQALQAYVILGNPDGHSFFDRRSPVESFCYRGNIHRFSEIPFCRLETAKKVCRYGLHRLHHR